MEIVRTRIHPAGNRFDRRPATIVGLSDMEPADVRRAHGRLGPLVAGAPPTTGAALLAAVASALSVAAGAPLAGARPAPDGETILVEGVASVAAAAAAAATALIAAAVAETPAPAATAAHVAQLREGLPPPSTLALLRAGTARGLSPRAGPAGTGHHLGEGVRMRRVLGTVGERTPFIAFETARGRPLVARLLAACGLPVLRQVVADSPASALAAVERLGGRAAVCRVTPDDAPAVPVATPAATVAAYAATADRGRALVVETPTGATWRFLVAGGRSVAAIGPTPASIGAAVHPDHHRLAEHAARVMAADVAAVDLVAGDIGRPRAETEVRIAAIRLGPDLEPFLGASATPDAVADGVLGALLADAGDGRIPIVAAAGEAAPAVVAALAARWRAMGRGVGTAGRAGLWVADLALFGDDRRGRHGLPLLVDHPLAEVALFEIDPEDLWQHGLGHPRVDVAVLAGGVPGPVAALLCRLADVAVVALPGVPAIASAVPWTVAADPAAAVAAAWEALGRR